MGVATGPVVAAVLSPWGLCWLHSRAGGGPGEMVQMGFEMVGVEGHATTERSGRGIEWL